MEETAAVRLFRMTAMANRKLFEAGDMDWRGLAVSFPR
jgi:hypothetical protein